MQGPGVHHHSLQVLGLADRRRRRAPGRLETGDFVSADDHSLLGNFHGVEASIHGEENGLGEGTRGEEIGNHGAASGLCTLLEESSHPGSHGAARVSGLYNHHGWDSLCRSLFRNHGEESGSDRDSLLCRRLYSP